MADVVCATIVEDLPNSTALTVALLLSVHHVNVHETPLPGRETGNPVMLNWTLATDLYAMYFEY